MIEDGPVRVNETTHVPVKLLDGISPYNSIVTRFYLLDF